MYRILESYPMLLFGLTVAGLGVRRKYSETRKKNLLILGQGAQLIQKKILTGKRCYI